jgi:hypothetical protein
MDNFITPIGTESEIVRLTQEAVELARRLGFGEPPCPQAVEQAVVNKCQVLDLLNGGGLFFWEEDISGD